MKGSMSATSTTFATSKAPIVAPATADRRMPNSRAISARSSTTMWNEIRKKIVGGMTSWISCLSFAQILLMSMVYSLCGGLKRAKSATITLVPGSRHRHATKVLAHRPCPTGGPIVIGFRRSAMRYGLATGLLLLALAGPATAQEIRPTLDKIKETGAIHLGHRETSRPFSFLGSDGQPAGYSVDLCLRVAAAVKETLKLADLKVSWLPVTPADRVSKLVKGTIDLECGSTTITFGRMEQVAFSHMIFVDGGSLLATTASGIGGVKDLAGKRFWIISNTTTEKALAAALAAASIKAQIITVPDHRDGLQGLEEGKL